MSTEDRINLSGIAGASGERSNPLNSAELKFVNDALKQMAQFVERGAERVAEYARMPRAEGQETNSWAAAVVAGQSSGKATGRA